MSNPGLVICHVSETLKEILNSFKFNKSKTNNALIMKVNKNSMEIELDQKLEDVDIDELCNELPSHEPRFVVLSYVYKQSDGRVSYPYCMIFSTPIGCKPELQMMYAGSLNNLITVGQITKSFEVRSPEEISVQWLEDKLKFFR